MFAFTVITWHCRHHHSQHSHHHHHHHHHHQERDSLFVPSLHTSTIVCSALSPWSKTGAFFYPRYFDLQFVIIKGLGLVMIIMKMTIRYPESWRGTACSLPRTTYFVPPLSSYRLSYDDDDDSDDNDDHPQSS